MALCFADKSSKNCSKTKVKITTFNYSTKKKERKEKNIENTNEKMN